PLFSRFMRAMGQAMRWTNDPANEKAAVELMIQRLKIDEAIAAQTYKFLITENRAFRGEGVVDGPGLAEMIRLLAGDNLIPERKPWETFVDSAFLATVNEPGCRAIGRVKVRHSRMLLAVVRLDSPQANSAWTPIRNFGGDNLRIDSGKPTVHPSRASGQTEKQ